MEHIFNNVELKKRNKIINKGLNEFSAHGFRRSSLNKILSSSEVSKGFFYHYFKNKEDFYNYLTNFGIDIILTKMNNTQLLEDRDFIRRLQSAAMIKNEIVMKYPNLMPFFTVVYTENSQEKIKEITQKLASDYSERVLTENIDYSLFREDIPIEASKKVVARYLAQLASEMEPMLKTISFQEISKYYTNELEVLKQTVYKKGE